MSSDLIMMTADQVQSDGFMKEEESNISKDCHIYFICKRPSAYFIKDTMEYDGKVLKIDVGYKINGNEERFSYKNDFSLLDNAVSLKVSDYPHREIITYDKEGKEVRHLPASFVTVGQGWESPLKQLEVLYVGQAFGNGSRSAHERLKNHSTLQKILADSYHKYPDSEISVLMFKFEPYQLLLSFDGRSNGAIGGNKDLKRFLSIEENPLSKKQQVGLVEAALIRYFQPEYNDIFKIKFPSPKVKLLKKCFELDFSGLAIEVITDELKVQLYSKSRKLSHHHICNIDIVDEKSRAGFFYITMGDGDMVKISSDVIEPSSYRRS